MTNLVSVLQRLFVKWSSLITQKIDVVFKSILKGLVLFYRVFFAQFFGGACRFSPSCSSYALEALSKHNSIFAFKLIIKRLSKCHPLGPFGEDPVPENKEHIYEQ